MEDRIVYVGDKVRIRYVRGALVFKGENDILVEVNSPNGWEKKYGYNSLSNDYAYTSARSDATALAAKL